MPSMAEGTFHSHNLLVGGSFKAAHTRLLLGGGAFPRGRGGPIRCACLCRT